MANGSINIVRRFILNYNYYSFKSLNKMDYDTLERLHLVHARLLYIISEMHAEQRISDFQKIALKSTFLS